MCEEPVGGRVIAMGDTFSLFAFSNIFYGFFKIYLWEEPVGYVDS